MKKIIMTLIVIAFAIVVIVPKILDVDGSGSLQSLWSDGINTISNYANEAP